MSRADSIALGASSPGLTATTTSGQTCLIIYFLPGSISGCSEPVPAVVPGSPWLQHSGGIFEPEQRAPISIPFGKVVHGIIMESEGALKCSGASLGRMIGYRDDVQVVNVENALIDPADCGADDVTFGVRGTIPANVAIDSLVLVGPDPWTFDVEGQQGRAILNYKVIWDPSLTLDCGAAARGQVASCQILGTVDAVSGWRFDGPVLPGLNDSVHITSPSTESSWSGLAVLSGTVSAVITVAGTTDTLSGSLTVSNRTGLAWRWDDGSKWTFAQDTTPICSYTAFRVNAPSRLGVNRRASTCAEFDVQQRVSIEPSIQSPASQDSGFTADSVTGGPNDGLWYVTAVHYYMHRASEMNPFIRPGGPTDTLTNNTDRARCRQALNLGNNVPVVVNFYTYNTACRSFSLTPLFNAILSHENLGTNNPLDPILANGHEARRRIAARDSINDPYRILEPMVRAAYAHLRLDLIHEVNDADQRIEDAADVDHALVKDNYLVQGNCGEAWVFDTTQLRYSLISMRQQGPTGTLVCI